MPIQSVNPATGQIEQSYEPFDRVTLARCVSQAQTAHEALRHMPVESRCQILECVAKMLEAQRDALANTMTREMGKTIVSARAEIDKCAWVCRYYAANGADLLADESLQSEASHSYRRYLPLGPVLAVMPWNFPFWQAFRHIAPSLVAGNSILLKHASNVPQCALAIESLFDRSEFPACTVQTLLVGSDRIADLVDDERIRAVTLTGSETAGMAIAAAAGAKIKKTLLELGGNDAFIVMPSADLDAAVAAAVKSRTQNNGQSCIAAKRFIVHESITDRFLERFEHSLEALTVGDPMDESTDVGPLSSKEALDKCLAQIDEALSRGAALRAGCERLAGDGYYLSPGILTVTAEVVDNFDFDEEIFGPVALVMPARSLDHAIGIANRSRFGLGSSIFTADEAEADEAVERLEAGSTFVNEIVQSHPNLPFGGIKASGYGRELSAEGIREFTNVKTVYRA
jgi:succinate-semialdehyde dehydrogenase/glutarate-semialdehyde dehydrogenase